MIKSEMGISVFGFHLSALSIVGYLIICVAALLQGQIWTKPKGLLRRFLKYALFGIAGIATAVLATIPLTYFGLPLDLFAVIYGGLWLGIAGAGIPHKLRIVARAHDLLTPTEERIKVLTVKRLEHKKKVQIAENAKLGLQRQIEQLEAELQDLALRVPTGKRKIRREKELAGKAKTLQELRAANRRNQARLRSATSKLEDVSSQQLSAIRDKIYFEDVNTTVEKQLSPERLQRFVLAFYLLIGPLVAAVVFAFSGSLGYALLTGGTFAFMGGIVLKGLFISQIAIFHLPKLLGETSDTAPWFSWKGFISAFGGLLISQLMLWVLVYPQNLLEGLVYGFILSLAAGGAGIASARIYEEVDLWTPQQIVYIGIALGMFGGALQLFQ